MAKVYLLSEEDFKKLEKNAELWEVKYKLQFPKSDSNNTVHDILRGIHYQIWKWFSEVKR